MSFLPTLLTKASTLAHAFSATTPKDIRSITYLPGYVFYDTDDFSDTHLAAAARLLRAYHAATTDFTPVIAADAEVFCHNDWTLANTVFNHDLPTGMIDFDTAARYAALGCYLQRLDVAQSW